MTALHTYKKSSGHSGKHGHADFWFVVTGPDVLYIAAYILQLFWGLKFTQQLSLKAKAGTPYWMTRETNCKHQQAQAAAEQEYLLCEIQIHHNDKRNSFLHKHLEQVLSVGKSLLPTVRRQNEVANVNKAV